MRLPSRLLQRSPDANKGDFGHILILAGSPKFSGAAVLAAEAGMRSRTGLVTLGVPRGINSPLIKIKPKEVMTLPLPQTREGFLGLAAYGKISDFAKTIDLLIVGPGLGRQKGTQMLVRKIVSAIDKPMVIDADGLNALAGHLKVLESVRVSECQSVRVLTPHPGEMSRLIGRSIKYIQKHRSEAAKEFAEKHRVVLVLKGHRTVVADHSDNFYENRTGNPGMSTAGSGDVLAGMIAAFLAQGLSGFEAAKYAVYLHGLAGDLAAKDKTQISLIASDIIAKIPEAVKRSS